MRIGIVAEGLFDQEVIRSILKGARGIQRADIAFLRPERRSDRTDRAIGASPHAMRPEEYGNWALVREECENRATMRTFLEIIDEQRSIVVHLDTDRAADYGVTKPPKDRKNNIGSYVNELCRRVVATVIGWLNGQYLAHVCVAVAIEEGFVPSAVES